MRVLLSAPACRPDAGSEPEIGWTTLLGAAASHEVVLLTAADSAADVRRGLDQAGVRSVRIVEIQDPVWLRRFAGRLGLGHLAYLIWLCRSWKVARQLQHEVDVAHHITLGGDWLPAAVHFLRDVPVVWGPVGGYAPVPWRLARYLTLPGIFTEVAREIVTRPLRWLTILVVRRSGCLVLAHNRDSARRFERAGAWVQVKPLIALPPVEAGPVARDGNRPLDGPGRRAVYVGRLVPWKGPFLAVRALSELSPEWTLELFGDGMAGGRIRRFARRLGLQDRVKLHGYRPREEIWRALREADVFLYPSMHDSAPQSVAQAVRAGCPVVCLDVAGPPLIMEGSGGIAVKPDRKAPQRLAEAIMRVRRLAPSDRWTAARLPAELTALYEAVIEAKAGS